VVRDSADVFNFTVAISVVVGDFSFFDAKKRDVCRLFDSNAACCYYGVRRFRFPFLYLVW
jgi:hypothetical protein